jgi:hypothetical protein
MNEFEPVGTIQFAVPKKGSLFPSAWRWLLVLPTAGFAFALLISPVYALSVNLRPSPELAFFALNFQIASGIVAGALVAPFWRWLSLPFLALVVGFFGWGLTGASYQMSFWVYVVIEAPRILPAMVLSAPAVWALERQRVGITKVAEAS